MTVYEHYLYLHDQCLAYASAVCHPDLEMFWRNAAASFQRRLNKLTPERAQLDWEEYKRNLAPLY